MEGRRCEHERNTVRVRQLEPISRALMADWTGYSKCSALVSESAPFFGQEHTSEQGIIIKVHERKDELWQVGKKYCGDNLTTDRAHQVFLRYQRFRRRRAVTKAPEMSETTTSGTAVIGRADDDADNNKRNDATSLSVSEMILMFRIAFEIYTQIRPTLTYGTILKIHRQGPAD